MSNFVHLHSHSSSHDTFGETKFHINRVKELGHKAFAQTEHGFLGNTIHFSNLCRAANIKPIIGNEIYFRIGEETYHLTILVKNQKGYENLVILNNLAKQNKNTITKDELFQYREGLIVLSGCPSSPFQRLPIKEAVSLGYEFKKAFGKDFWIEVQFVIGREHYDRAFELARNLKIRAVVTNDNHFAYEDHASWHKMFLRELKGYEYDSSQLWIKSRDEIVEAAKTLVPEITDKVLNGILDASVEIADQCEEIILKDSPKLPHFENAKELFKYKVYKGFIKLGLRDNQEYVDRLNYEMSVILNAGYETYFLILYDLIDYCKKENIPVGIGRGSAAGSLVSYVLGITGIDPIKYGLIFERFLNPERLSLPDVDTDIGRSGRQKLLDYASEKYDALQIAAYDKFKVRSAMQYFGKYFEIFDEQRKKYKDYEDSEIDNVVKNDFPEFYNFFNFIDGQIKNISRHAGGIAIFDRNKQVPFEVVKDGTIVLGYSEGGRSDLSDAGIVKFDMLGLAATDIILELQTTTGVVVDIENIPDEVYDIFRSGNTSGIFQFTHEGNRSALRRVKPNSLNDLSIMNALWREAVVRSGTTEAYVKSVEENTFRHIHPEIDEILKETNGWIVYQEQFMKIYAFATDSSFGKSDIARKAVVKFKEDDPKSIKALEDVEKSIKKGLSDKGFDDKIIDTLWAEIYSQRLYSFNKAHAVSYAAIALTMAYYKHFHPQKFYAAALNNRPDYELQDFFIEAATDGSNIVKPSINESDEFFTADDDNIYLPLTALKGFGEKAAAAIIEERKRGGKFTDLKDLVERTSSRAVNRKILRIIVENKLMDYPEIYDDAEELKVEYEKLTEKQISQKYYNKFKIITPHVAKLITQHNNKGDKFVAGVITKKISKINKKGNKYFSYVVSPSRQINSDKYELEEGTIFYSVINSWNRIVRVTK